MSTSILTTTKKLLGIAEEDTSFDTDVMMHINSVFLDLSQLGVGPATGFAITDKTDQWAAFLGADLNLNAVQSYMYMRVKLMFDPPASGYAIDSLKDQIAKAEWRLNVHHEATEWVPPEPVQVLDYDSVWGDEVIIDGNAG